MMPSAGIPRVQVSARSTCAYGRVLAGGEVQDAATRVEIGFAILSRRLSVTMPPSMPPAWFLMPEARPVA
jgi:hypothetical protein